ncbi:MAG TPA: hypothetical protein QF353_03775 [Gammaproteobacteria bacterium]|nr:hypothetical protein [Gammaproteobacteria bacterium]
MFDKKLNLALVAVVFSLSSSVLAEKAQGIVTYSGDNMIYISSEGRTFYVEGVQESDKYAVGDCVTFERNSEYSNTNRSKDYATAVSKCKN